MTPLISLEKYDFAKDSFYAVLEKEGLVWEESEENVEASLAGEVYSQLLKVTAISPVLKLGRLSRLQNGIPFERTTMKYRADKYKNFY